MTRVQAVLHLVQYDARRTKWWWLAYLVILGGAAVLARDVGADSPGTSWNLFSWAHGVMAIAFSAVLTRDSSPRDSRAFLAAKPISATVFATAKILQLAAMVVLTAVAAGWAAAPNGWPLQHGVISVLPATTSFFLLLVAGGYVGLVTRTATATTFVWVLGGVGAMLALQLDGLGEMPFAESGVELLTLLVPFCCVASALLFAQLADSRFRRLSLTGGVVLVAVSLLGQCAVLTTPLTKAENPSSVEPLVERASLMQFGDSGISSNIIAMRIEPLRNDRYYRFESGTFVCAGRRADGTAIRDESEVRGMDVHSPDRWGHALLNFAGMSWNVPPEPPPVRDVVSVGPACSTRITRIDRVALTGRVARYHLERVFEQPFRLGLLNESGGQRWRLQCSQTAVELHFSGLLSRSPGRDPSSIAGFEMLSDLPVIIVIDSTMKRAYRLDQGGYGESLAPVVLPALHREYRWFELRKEPALEQLLSSDTARASIAVYRWVRDGEITVSFEQAGGSWFQRPLD